ncbi:MAG TPA: ankyrin repeat domain-containing protein, partial [Coxiellaceae bacterium]|nr:ankyrin repeat domain-containing protein [Coxiellaceae bacterium]
KILIKYGADIHIKRKDNKDAITLAKEKNNKEIINLINAKLKKGK